MWLTGGGCSFTELRFISPTPGGCSVGSTNESAVFLQVVFKLLVATLLDALLTIYQIIDLDHLVLISDLLPLFVIFRDGW